MKKLFALAASLFLFSNLAFAVVYGRAYDDVTLASDWMETYYLKPEPEKFFKTVSPAFKDESVLNSGAKFPLISFTSEVLKANPKKLNGWCKDFSKLPEQGKFYFAVSVKQSQLESKQCFSALKLNSPYDEKIKELPFLDVKTMIVSIPPQLDTLWGAFMASGDQVYLNKIIEVAEKPLPVEIPKDLPRKKTEFITDKDLAETVLIGVARLSLIANSEKHPVVEKAIDGHEVIAENVLDFLFRGHRFSLLAH